MKAIILGVSSAAIVVAGMAAPAQAIGISGAHSTAIASKGQVSMGIGPNGAYFYGGSTTCFSSAGVFNMNFHEATPVAQSTVQQTPDQACNANDVVSNPPANSTVTINGLCNEEAAKAKTNISGDNVKVIVNATGPCEEKETPTPVVVTVTPRDDSKNNNGNNATTVSAKGNGGESAPVTEMPETGIAAAPIVGGGLATLSYAGALVARRIRRG